MTEKELNNFIDNVLKGAFPKWEQTAYLVSMWKNKVSQYDYTDACRAISRYHDKETYKKEPDWKRFYGYLKEIIDERIQAAKRNSIYILFQCFESYRPSILGSYYLTRFSLPAHITGADVENSLCQREIYTPAFKDTEAYQSINEMAHSYSMDSRSSNTYLPVYDGFSMAMKRRSACNDYFQNCNIDPSIGTRFNLKSIIPSDDELRSMPVCRRTPVNAPLMQKLRQTLPDIPPDTDNATGGKFGAFREKQEFDDIPF